MGVQNVKQKNTYIFEHEVILKIRKRIIKICIFYYILSDLDCSNLKSENFIHFYIINDLS
jgi:hypothetical protein